MDGPKTVVARWQEVPFLEANWWAFLLPVIAAFLVVLFLWWRRRKATDGPESATEESAVAPDAHETDADSEASPRDDGTGKTAEEDFEL